MSSSTKKLRQSIDNQKKGIAMEKKHATTMVKGGCQSGGVATASQKVFLPNIQTNIKTPILKVFTFSELQSTTRNFGEDTYIDGRVYMGWLDAVTYAPQKVSNGLPVAIKRSRLNSLESHEEFQRKVEFLGRFSHPNIVKFFGYCWEDKKSLLVYEYMQNGSLESHLFGNGREPLAWDTRIKIAMGAAQGLAFLHTTENNVICEHVKSSNIMLDGEFNVKLMDFGLAKSLAFSEEFSFSACLPDTNGYEAPEYRDTGHLDLESDVYGFGVVMLEMITGLCADRRPSQPNLVNWAMPSLTDIKKLRKIMDPRLERVYPPIGAMKLAKLIQDCLQQNPKHQPSMEQVVAQLEEINAIKITPGKLYRIAHAPNEPTPRTSVW